MGKTIELSGERENIKKITMAKLHQVLEVQMALRVVIKRDQNPHFCSSACLVPTQVSISRRLKNKEL